jgi:hypothetical protein
MKFEIGDIVQYKGKWLDSKKLYKIEKIDESTGITTVTVQGERYFSHMFKLVEDISELERLLIE